jgi:hypothetical protein
MTTHVVQQLVEEQEVFSLDPYCVYSGKRAKLRIRDGSVSVRHATQGALAQTLLEGELL